MSKDALAGVYAQMLTDEGFRSTVAEQPEVLATWDLTSEERELLVEDAATEVAAFAIGSGGVMGHLGSGPQLSPGVASGLGLALNVASGLPTGALKGPGFASGAGCCPWGHAVVSSGLMNE
jgi:hypothetical protein